MYRELIRSRLNRCDSERNARTKAASAVRFVGTGQVSHRLDIGDSGDAHPGQQYTSTEFAQLCAHHQVVQSIGATGISGDNAAESISATLKRELVHRHAWVTRAQAKRAIVRWIEGRHNPRRLHSSIESLTPNEKENAWHTADRRVA